MHNQRRKLHPSQFTRCGRGRREIGSLGGTSDVCCAPAAPGWYTPQGSKNGCNACLRSLTEATMDVAAWLSNLGLERYKQAFEDNAIDFALLSKLTADDLRDIGITAVGDRRRLLEAIAALQEKSRGRGAKPEPPTASVSRPRDAERRQLTVMFVDLVGSTALSARLDPEDMREVVGAYHRCCEDLIAKAGGFVAKYMGDGVLAYFGYPQAHEHDAERAVQAGLALVEAAPKLNTVAGV